MAHRRLPAAFFLLLVAGFYIADHGAFRGYFQNDDLDNLSFTRELELPDFIRPLLIPRVFENNFRPVGHLFYYVLGRTAELNYAPYVVCLWVLHLANVALLWLVLRRLGISVWGSSAGALFWAFDMACFDVFWKPMYVFDLLCGFFCLLSLLAYEKGHWVLSLLAMWLGYRSKEIAVMLPVVIAAYEFWFGGKRWRRTLPFFALSLLLGIQALAQNHNRAESDYTLHLNPAALWTCISFYASKVFLIPYAGLAVLLLWLVRRPAVRFGIVTFCVLLVPMLLLPGRLYSAYLYVPLIGLAIAAGAVAETVWYPITALFFLLWLPWNYINLRWDRAEALADSQYRRAYVVKLAAFSRKHPEVRSFIVYPGPLNGYGTRAAIRLVHAPGTAIRMANVESPEAREIGKLYPVALLKWDPSVHDLGILTRDANTPDAAYIKMGLDTPFWQLDQGWFEADGAFRWIEPLATARLRRPAGANRFRLVVNVGPDLLKHVRHSHVTVSIDGIRIGDRDFTKSGFQSVEWDLAAGEPGAAEIEIQAEPAFRMPDSKPLGIAIVSFGFPPKPG